MHTVKPSLYKPNQLIKADGLAFHWIHIKPPQKSLRRFNWWYIYVHSVDWLKFEMNNFQPFRWLFSKITHRWIKIVGNAFEDNERVNRLNGIPVKKGNHALCFRYQNDTQSFSINCRNLNFWSITRFLRNQLDFNILRLRRIL